MACRLILFCTVTVVLLWSPSGADGQTVDFQREVRPILADNCFRCHGPDESSRQVRLRLDTEEGAFAERPNGQPVVPGDPSSSLLYQRVTHDNQRLRMPPVAANKTLTDEQIDILERWIAQGASWDQHWAFKAVTKSVLPAVSNESWVRNPVDQFILAELDATGLEPAPEADKRTIARRVALDLTGLPPDPVLLERFLAFYINFSDTGQENNEKLDG